MRLNSIILLCAILAALISCTAGGASFDDGSAYVVTGQLVDEDGKGIADAIVTIDGVQGKNKTDEDGTFVVYTDLEPGAEVFLTATRAGKKPAVTQATVKKSGDVAEVESDVTMSADLEPDRLEISGPNPGQIVNPDDDCVLGITVSGYAHREALVANNDILIIIDASGSTADPAMDQGAHNIFDQEIVAARRLVSRLQKHAFRVGIIRFATDATLVLEPTDDNDVIMQALADIKQAGPELRGEQDAASDFEEAMLLAASTFATRPWTMADPETEGATVSVTAHRRVLFFTDGIPTLPEGKGDVQDPGDITATLAAARELAADGIIVHGFAIGPEIETNRLTTLPSVAAITDGSYLPINSQRDVELEMDLIGWFPIDAVTITNTATGESVVVSPQPDGYFEAEIAVVVGEQTLTVSTDGERPASEDVSVEGVIPGLNDVPYALLDDTVAALGFLRPDGSPLAANDQANLDNEVGVTATQTTAEVFTAHSDRGTVTATVSAAFMRKEAGWKCDVGYLVLDSSLEDPTTSIPEVLAAATSDNVLFNTKDFQDYHTYEPGTADFSFDVPAGSRIVFFIVANGTLAQAQAGKKPIHYTVARYNGGGYTQHIAFYVPDGRRDAGDSVGILLAFEDIPLTRNSDRDYSDAILYITGLVSSSIDCLDQVNTGN